MDVTPGGFPPMIVKSYIDRFAPCQLLTGLGFLAAGKWKLMKMLTQNDGIVRNEYEDKRGKLVSKNNK